MSWAVAGAAGHVLVGHDRPVRGPRSSRRVVAGLVGVLVAVLPCGCAAFVPDERVDAARAQWDSLPDDARSGLGVGESRESLTGSGVPTDLSLEADLDLPAPAADDTLGGPLIAACLGVVAALQGTDLQAFGELPLTDGPVAATDETCARGLGLGRWAPVPVPEPAIRAQTLELGRGDGTSAELLGLTVDLAARTLTANSDSPPREVPLSSVGVADFDRALAAASTPLPWSVAAPETSSLLVVVPAGTPVDVTATCGVAESVDALSVEADPHLQYQTQVLANGGDFPAGELDEAHVNCLTDPGGTARATVTPVLSYAPGKAYAVDVVALQVITNDPNGIATLTVAAR